LFRDRFNVKEHTPIFCNLDLVLKTFKNFIVECYSPSQREGALAETTLIEMVFGDGLDGPPLK